MITHIQHDDPTQDLVVAFLAETLLNEVRLNDICDNLNYGRNLKERQVLQDDIGSLCSKGPKTTLHALWECEASQPVWNQIKPSIGWIEA